MIVTLLPLTLVLGAALAAASAQNVTGTASFDVGTVSLEGAVLEATLEDVSRADAAAGILARTEVTHLTTSPVTFGLAYDHSQVVENRRYVVRVRITRGGQLLFVSDVAAPVITGGHPLAVSLVLRPVPPDTSTRPAPSALDGTEWRAVEIYGTAVTASDTARDPQLAFQAGGRVAGADGCNRLAGGYTLKGSNLSFGPMMGTQMACPGVEDVSKRFRDALIGTGHFAIIGGRLHLYGATGKPLAILEKRQK